MDFDGTCEELYFIYYVVRGGWPAAIAVQEKAAGEMAKAYIETIIKNDIFKLDNKSYDLSKIRLLLRSLACALLKASPKKLKADLQTFGFLFEALCERDLNIYAQCLGGQLYHYQDYKNQEIDAVIELSDGRWGAFEIKLGANQIDDAAASLLSIQQNIVKAGGQAPAVLCVVCGLVTGVYRRPDGVYVVPITALKP